MIAKVIGCALLLAGVFIFLTAVVGLYRMRYILNRMHAAALLDYRAEGICVGMQVLNCEPVEYVVGLTEPCAKALPLLVETIAAELDKQGFTVVRRA